MSAIGIGTQKYTLVDVIDEPGPSGACHRYAVDEKGVDVREIACFASVHFQEGPVLENGVNGCHNEDLLVILIHRLVGFQSGEFACAENGLALAYLRRALLALQLRTAERESRGVEGTSVL